MGFSFKAMKGVARSRTHGWARVRMHTHVHMEMIL